MNLVGKKVYLSSGFFDEETRQEVETVAKWLRRQGAEVFVPMEHTIPNAMGYSFNEWSRRVFMMDVREIDKADIVVYLDWGHNGDCGAAWECGYAWAKYIPVYTIYMKQTASLMIQNTTTRLDYTLHEVKFI